MPGRADIITDAISTWYCNKDAHLVNLTDMLLIATKVNNMSQSIRLSILIWAPKKQNVSLPDSYICRLACLFVSACHACHWEGLGVGQATNKNTVFGLNQTWSYMTPVPSVWPRGVSSPLLTRVQAHSPCSNPLNQQGPFYYIGYWSKRPLVQMASTKTVSDGL